MYMYTWKKKIKNINLQVTFPLVIFIDLHTFTSESSMTQHGSYQKIVFLQYFHLRPYLWVCFNTTSRELFFEFFLHFYMSARLEPLSRLYLRLTRSSSISTRYSSSCFVHLRQSLPFFPLACVPTSFAILKSCNHMLLTCQIIQVANHF